MTCPRCQRPMQRNHDEWVCMTHGTQEMPVTQAEEFNELTADDISRLVRARLRSLASDADSASRLLESCREEAAKLGALLDAMNATYTMPDILKAKGKKAGLRPQRPLLACPECGDQVRGAQGMGVHKAKKHGSAA